MQLMNLQITKPFILKLKVESIFLMYKPHSEVLKILILLPGKHNVMNALAALAMADVYGVPLEEIKQSLLSFKGVKEGFRIKSKQKICVLLTIMRIILQR